MSTTEPTAGRTQFREPWFLSNDNGDETWVITDGVEWFPITDATQAELGLAVRGTIERALAVAPEPSEDDLRAAEQLDTLSRLLAAEGWGQHYIDAVTHAARALGRNAPCRHENTHMRGWTQVCDDCGQGREIR